jgi:hypothetical protein
VGLLLAFSRARSSAQTRHMTARRFASYASFGSLTWALSFSPTLAPVWPALTCASCGGRLLTVHSQR